MCVALGCLIGVCQYCWQHQVLRLRKAVTSIASLFRTGPLTVKDPLDSFSQRSKALMTCSPSSVQHLLLRLLRAEDIVLHRCNEGPTNVRRLDDPPQAVWLRMLFELACLEEQDSAARILFHGPNSSKRVFVRSASQLPMAGRCQHHPANNAPPASSVSGSTLLVKTELPLSDGVTLLERFDRSPLTGEAMVSQDTPTSLLSRSTGAGSPRHTPNVS